MKKMHILSVLAIALSSLLFSFSTDSLATAEQAISKDVTHINGSRVVFTQVVHLEGENEIPSVDTDAKGIAILRMTEDRVLYSKVIVTKVDPMEDGVVTAAHIHFGGATTTGGVMITLVSNSSEFGMNIVHPKLTVAQYNAILNDPLYVNAHSTMHMSGLVRGQIR